MLGLLILAVSVLFARAGVYHKTQDEQTTLMKDMAALHGLTLDRLMTIHEYMQEHNDVTREALGEAFAPVSMSLGASIVTFELGIPMMQSFADEDEMLRYISVAELANGGAVTDNIARSMLESIQKLNATLPSDISLGEAGSGFRETVSALVYDWKRMSVRAKVAMHRLSQNIDKLIIEESMRNSIMEEFILGPKRRMVKLGTGTTPEPGEFAGPITTTTTAAPSSTTSAAKKRKHKKKKSASATASSDDGEPETSTSTFPVTRVPPATTMGTVTPTTSVPKTTAAPARMTKAAIPVEDASAGEWEQVVHRRVRTTAAHALRKSRRLTTAAPTTTTGPVSRAQLARVARVTTSAAATTGAPTAAPTGSSTRKTTTAPVTTTKSSETETTVQHTESLVTTQAVTTTQTQTTTTETTTTEPTTTTTVQPTESVASTASVPTSVSTTVAPATTESAISTSSLSTTVAPRRRTWRPLRAASAAFVPGSGQMSSVAPAAVVVQPAVAAPLARLCELSRQIGASLSEMASICDYTGLSADPMAAAHIAHIRQMINVMYHNGAILDSTAKQSLSAFQPYILLIPSTPAPSGQ